MLTRIHNPAKREDGFTLIELLVVIIVIGILAAIAIPLFLDQRKLAVDASVKSDVRNTSTQVQTWLSQNPGSVATDATDYTTKGGKVVSTGSNTVGVSVATNGTYLVCGYAGSTAKQYTATSAAYVFDSSTGKFGNGTCSGGIVGGGASSTPAPSTSTPTPVTPVAITTTTLPNATAGQSYTTTIAASGSPTTFSATGLPDGLNLTNAGVLSGTVPDDAAHVKDFTVVITASNTSGGSDNKTYTLKVGGTYAYYDWSASNTSTDGWTGVNGSSVVVNQNGQYKNTLAVNNTGNQATTGRTMNNLTVGGKYHVTVMISPQASGHTGIISTNGTTKSQAIPLNQWSYIDMDFTPTATAQSLNVAASTASGASGFSLNYVYITYAP